MVGELICIGNIERYRQHPELRKRLFGTVGLLVEAVPGKKSPWSCGLRSDNPDALDRDRWPQGCINLNGDLLSYVKDKLANEDQYADEYKAVIEESTLTSRPAKRNYENESPESWNKKSK